MASIETYHLVAPDVMEWGGFNDAQAIDRKIANRPKAPEETTVSTPTRSDIIALFNSVFEAHWTIDGGVRRLGGLQKTASMHGMTIEQCKTCLKQFKKMIVAHDEGLNT